MSKRDREPIGNADKSRPVAPRIDEARQLIVESAPRRADFASQNGSYEPVVRIHTPVLDPRDTLKGDVFITGYGMIQRAKCVTYPAPGVFETTAAIIRFGFDPTKDVPVFGGEVKRGLDETGLTISFTGGMRLAHWREPTMFFDIGPGDPPQISMECQLGGHSPIEFELPIRKDAKPGQYSLTFSLTYYDGDQWRNASQTATFAIRNRFQRSEGVLITLGAFAAAAGILSFFVDFISALTG